MKTEQYASSKILLKNLFQSLDNCLAYLPRRHQHQVGKDGMNQNKKSMPSERTAKESFRPRLGIFRALFPQSSLASSNLANEP